MALESQYLNSHTIHHPCRRIDLGEFLKNLVLYNYSLSPRLVDGSLAWSRTCPGVASFGKHSFSVFFLQICKQINGCLDLTF